MQHNGIPNDTIDLQLEKILSSRVFASADRPTRFLRFIVQRTLAGGEENLKEYPIGVEVLGRKPSFDREFSASLRTSSRAEHDSETVTLSHPVMPIADGLGS
jgi:hypothetical protein